MTDRDKPQILFRKSTFSDAGEGCVEAAILDTSRLLSKDPDGRMPTGDTAHGESEPTELING